MDDGPASDHNLFLCPDSFISLFLRKSEHNQESNFQQFKFHVVISPEKISLF